MENFYYPYVNISSKYIIVEREIIIVNINKPKSKQKQNMNVIPEIGVRDFVVRTNVFKCMHNKHNINNIAAMINIDNDNLKAFLYTSRGRKLKEACEQLKHVDDREEYNSLIDEIYKSVSLLDVAVFSEIPDKR